MTFIIIVTGASGFIGGRIAYYFACKGFTVLAPLRNGSEVLLPHKNITSTSYGDIITALLNMKSIHAIIHCAALTTANSNDNELIFSTNLYLDEAVAQWIDVFCPKKVIFMSTVSVYGKIKDDILRLNTTPIDPNPYGLSKLASEALLTYRCIQSGASISIIRLPGTVGYGSHGNIITKAFEAALSKQSNKSNKKLLLSNPNSLFNNIVPIDSLLGFVHMLVCKSSLEYPVLLTLLASKEPIPFRSVIEHILSSFSIHFAELIDWSESLSPAFYIDCSHAISHGYEAPSTKESLDMVKFDICNPPICPRKKL